jgi:hypothetical protein
LIIDPYLNLTLYDENIQGDLVGNITIFRGKSIYLREKKFRKIVLVIRNVYRDGVV